ncbi:hypothetical protein Amet_1742 [Alkaliphilus metalliredigens QYMF]|uniref:Uncharacterized protein n=1 Tax=Alkaliphilus metalliredigens (strain QYMF) TaxID=293826 RepID=A6TNZ9_ALKMQ|nr:hypothetical protein Amet_1742 [Alkaliphilus metalliredigens QYMF]
MKKKLNALISDAVDLTSPEAIEISQELDKLLNEYNGYVI